MEKSLAWWQNRSVMSGFLLLLVGLSSCSSAGYVGYGNVDKVSTPPPSPVGTTPPPPPRTTAPLAPTDYPQTDYTTADYYYTLDPTALTPPDYTQDPLSTDYYQDIPVLSDFALYISHVSE